MLVFVGHACVIPIHAYAERDAPGLQSDPQPGDRSQATPHVSSCEVIEARPACLAIGQAMAEASLAVPSRAPGVVTLGTERSPTFARLPHVLLHAPLRI